MMNLRIFPTILLLMVFFIILAASAVATAPACSEAITRRGTFTLGGTSFQYLGADDATGTEPKVRLKNLVSGETVDRDAGLQATFLLVSERTIYHFGSFGDYDQMDYDIILHNPCDRGQGCTETISKGEQFTLGGTSFEYRGADPAGGTAPKIRFKNLVTGETVDRDVGLHATFRLPEGGVSYGFGSVGAFDRDDYNIIWLYPCEGVGETKAAGERKATPAEKPRGINRFTAWLKRIFVAPPPVAGQPSVGQKAESREALAGQVYATANPVRRGELILALISNIDTSNGELLEYQGADANSVAYPQIAFKRLSTGETFRYPLVVGRAEVWFPGFAPQRFSISLTDSSIINSPLVVDYNGDGTFDGKHTGATVHYLFPSTTGRGCDDVITLLQGATATIHPASPLPDYSVDVTVVNVASDAASVEVAFDGSPVMADTLAKGTSREFGGIYVTLLDTLYQDYAGGVRQASLCLNYVE